MGKRREKSRYAIPVYEGVALKAYEIHRLVPGGSTFYKTDIHPFYAVKVLVTREGDVHEVERQEIYRNYSCFDYGTLTLDDD